MGRTKTLKIFSFILLSIVIAFAGFMLVGCGDKELTTLTIKLAEDKNSFDPGETVAFTFVADGKFKEEEVSLVVLGPAEATGQSVKVNDDAVPGETVSVKAEYGEIVSNTVTFSVAHIEATEIFVSADKSEVYRGEIVGVTVEYSPLNATREVEFEVEDNAKIDDGRLIVDSDATDGEIISVVVKMGEVRSEPCTFRVKTFNDDDIFSLAFKNSELNIDASVDSTTQNIDIVMYLLSDSEQGYEEFITNLPTLSVVSGEDVVEIADGKLKAIGAGTATIKLSYANFEDEMTVNVLMAPDQIKLPSNFEKSANYNYEKVKPIAFEMSVVGAHNNENYKMVVSGTENVTFNCHNGVWEGDSENISYDGTNLTIQNVGEYTIRFESVSGCITEVKSPTTTITINEGKNISTKEEFISAFSSKEDVVLNITSDIYFVDGHETMTSYGDKTIYGNGFMLNAEGQHTDKEFSYSGKNFLVFKNENKNEKFDVTIEDLTLVGNMGLLTREELAEFKGVTPEEIDSGMKANRYYVIDSGYRWAITISAMNGIQEETTGANLAYATIHLNNISVRKFNSAFNLEHCFDEVELGTGDNIALNNIEISNMFGDGIRNMGSMFNIGNVNFGTCGGSPITQSNTDVSKAGLNRNESAYSNIIGNLTCDNVTDGSSLYTAAEIMSVSGLQAIFGGGLSGMINAILSLKEQELVAPYIGKPNEREMKMLVAESKSNVLRTGSGSDSFNLFCFTRSGLENYHFSEENLAQMVDLDEDFFYNGVDTTHKFVKAGVYELVMSIETLGEFKEVIEANKDALKPIEVILVNFNYQEN